MQFKRNEVVKMSKDVVAAALWNRRVRGGVKDLIKEILINESIVLVEPASLAA